MVTRITSGKDIKGALYYNEKKVAAGKAKCIQTSGFLKAPADMNFSSKLQRFINLNKKNIRTKTNTMHININFHKSESYPEDVLNSIASAYMEKIGFGGQPFLVYEHFDAAHQHMHIVTTLIQENGKRIPINMIGENESEKARKEIEVDFNLMQAQGQGKKEDVDLVPVSVSKAVYGISETKKSINDIVRHVTEKYMYTSISELNAALNRYNVVADPGKEGTAMFDRKGLIYSIIDDRGRRIGVPVKASRLSFKPTLPKLEKRFKYNQKLRVPLRGLISKKVFDAMTARPTTMAELQAQLKKVNVELVTRVAKDGRVFGITFIDLSSHAIFNGSDLSKLLSANNIRKLLNVNQQVRIEKRLAIVKAIPWQWKRITSFIRSAESLVNKEVGITQTNYPAYKRKSDPQPGQYQLPFGEQHRSAYVSGCEYLWTGITMTYGAGMHTSEDPLGLNRKKKKKKKRRSM